MRQNRLQTDTLKNEKYSINCTFQIDPFISQPYELRHLNG